MAVFGKTKTVDTIMASFQKTITDLRFVEENSARTAEAIENEIRMQEAARDANHAESIRASTIAGKLEKLISDD